MSDYIVPCLMCGKAACSGANGLPTQCDFTTTAVTARAPSLKPTNPKDAVGIAKVPMSCVPQTVLGELALAMGEGSLKYGRHNFRVSGVRASVYFDAAWRHLAAWWEGQDVDPDSGLPHIVKAIACLTVLRDAQLQEKCIDDRPPVGPAALADSWIAELNQRMGALLKKYPNPPKAATALSMGED